MARWLRRRGLKGRKSIPPRRAAPELPPALLHTRARGRRAVLPVPHHPCPSAIPPSTQFSGTLLPRRLEILPFLVLPRGDSLRRGAAAEFRVPGGVAVMCDIMGLHFAIRNHYLWLSLKAHTCIGKLMTCMLFLK